jgi:3-oxoacyl-(acyl-carrier-protein) synthase
MERAVAITGLGLATPIGVGQTAFWGAAKEGRSGTGRITLVDDPNLTMKVAGELSDFDATAYMHRKLVVRTDRNTQFAFASCAEALQDSGLDPAQEDKSRMGIVLGANYGGAAYCVDNLHRLHQKGPSFVSAYMAIAWIPSAPVGQLSIFYGTSGYSKTIINDSNSGIDAIGASYRAIARGEADVIITGGFDSPMADAPLEALATFPDLCKDAPNPERAYRPFDTGRAGTVIAEGGGILVLEEMQRARERGARVYGQIVGFAQTSDVYDMHGVAPDGVQYARCMTIALQKAGLSPDEVSTVVADGRATCEGDRGEATALRAVFGQRAETSLPISAPKSMTGNAFAGAGPIDAAFALLAMHDGVIAPTINLEHQDPACGICLVTEPGHQATVDVALVASRGTAGVNSALVVRRAD